LEPDPDNAGVGKLGEGGRITPVIVLSRRRTAPRPTLRPHGRPVPGQHASPAV